MMALAVDIMDGCGISNKESCECLPKETKGDTVLAICFIRRGISRLVHQQHGRAL